MLSLCMTLIFKPLGAARGGQFLPKFIPKNVLQHSAGIGIPADITDASCCVTQECVVVCHSRSEPIAAHVVQ